MNDDKLTQEGVVAHEEGAKCEGEGVVAHEEGKKCEGEAAAAEAMPEQA